MTRRTGYVILTFAVGIAYRLLMGMQGFDAVDTGFSMTFYRNFFEHPDAIPFYFNFYLTGLLGGLWEMGLGQWGLMGFRVLETLLLALAIALLYGAFRRHLPSTGMAVAAVGVSFLFPAGAFITFYYNTLSYVLMAASVHALMRWLHGGRWLWLAMAGAWVGLSFFARTVNGVWGLLVVLPWALGLRHSWREGWRNAFTYVAGIVCGAGLVLCVMAWLGHWPWFLEGLNEAVGTLSDGEASHSSGNLFGCYFKSGLNVLIIGLALSAIAWLYARGQRLATLPRRIWSAVLLAGLGALVLTNRPYASALAACTAMLLAAGHPSWGGTLYAPVPPRRFVALGFYTLMAAYILPFGSDTGIESIFNKCGALLVVPATCCWQWLAGRWQRQIVGGLCVFVCAGMLTRTLKRPYGEPCSRLEATTVAVPGTLNVMVHEERALRCRNVVARVAQHGEAYPCMFVANQAAEMYYATGKWPFTGNTMLNSFKGESLIRRLEERRARYGMLPMVVFLEYGRETEDRQRQDAEETRKALRPWMEENGYRSAYKDGDIEIFKPDRQ